MTHMQDVVIVGGGIGGLASALAIQKSATTDRIQVLERAPEFGEIGAGLQLAPNAMRVLERLGVAEEVDDCAFFPGRLVMLDILTGEQITSLDLGRPFRSRYGKPYAVMHRSDLHRILFEATKRHDNIDLRTGAQVTGVENVAQSPTVITSDGGRHHGDLVIGADGLRSALREQLVADGAPVNARYVSYRGTVPFDLLSEHAGGQDVLLWVGPRMHLVQYPVRRGELYNQVVTFESDNYSPDHDDWGDAQEMEQRFAHVYPTARAGVELIQRDRYWQMLDREPVQDWVYGRVALMGDAAHPMLQYLAQGACQALEDAVTLGDTLHSSPNLDSALAAYQRQRVTHTATVQRTARQFGEILHVAGMGASLRNALLKSRAADDYSQTDWLYQAS